MVTKEDSFPWQFFDRPTDSAAEAVVRWIYSEFSARAYRGFLEQGRGLLVGPFLSGEGRDLIATEEFVERRKMNREIGLTVAFVALNSTVFETTLPDAALREQLAVAIERYDPTRECVILLLANNVPCIARIVGSTSRIDARNSQIGIVGNQSETIH
jgi:hypothetical protein